MSDVNIVLRTRHQVDQETPLTCETWLTTSYAVSCFAVRTARWHSDRSASGRTRLSPTSCASEIIYMD